MQNIKNVGHCLTITSQSGITIIDPPISVFDEVRDDVIGIDDASKEKFEMLATNGESS